MTPKNSFSHDCAKVLVIGADGSGKASFIHMWGNNPPAAPVPSWETVIKAVQLPNRTLRCQVWSVPCEDVPAKFYRGVDGVIYMYDSNRLESLQAITKEYHPNLIKNNLDHVPAILVCNKTPPPYPPTATPPKDTAGLGALLARENGWLFKSISVQQNVGVDDVMLELCKSIQRVLDEKALGLESKLETRARTKAAADAKARILAGEDAPEDHALQTSTSKSTTTTPPPTTPTTPTAAASQGKKQKKEDNCCIM